MSHPFGNIGHNAGPEHYCQECRPVKQLSGGWSMDHAAYSPVSKAKAYSLFDAVRDTIEIPTTDAMIGDRFKNDNRLFLRLESMYAEEEFMKCPRACITGALIECAQADWWYEHEKKWDDDEIEPEEYEDE